MAIIGSASVQIRALDNLFQADVKKAVDKIKDVSIKIVADFDDDGVQEKLDRVRRRAEAETINFRATADTSAAQHDIDHLYQHNNGRTVELNATAQTTDAAAQLAYTSRSRIVSIYPVVNAGALATAKAILESLSGINTLRTLKDMLKNLATGFDTAAIKAVTFSSAIMGLISSIGWLAAEAFSAGEGVAQLVGFFAMAPTLIGAATTAIVTNHLAWDNFGAALSDNVTKSTKALALLPPNAREAAVEVKKLWADIKKPVQGAFWDGMGTSLQDTLTAMAPALKTGLTDTATHLGKFSKSIAESFKQIAENKTLDVMFKNLGLGMDALGVGIKPLFDAFNTLGFVGSNYLPKLGKWMADLAIRFDNFIKKAAAAGDIQRWIDNAVSAMEDLWRIGDGVVGIFQGLTRAMNAAGAGGLDQLGTSLKEVEKVVKGPVFQSQFGQIFAGMLKGAHAVKEGFADFGKSLGNSSQVVGAIFTQAGGVVKELLGGIAALISTEGFQVGVLKAFGAIKNGLDTIRPSFENLGKIIGDLLEIASVIFTSIAPVINNATTLIAGAVDNVKKGFMDAVPVLMGFVSSLITAFSGPILAVSKVIGDIASAFAGLPGPLQGIIMAIGLGMLLLPRFTKALAGIQKGMRDAATGSENARTSFQWLNRVGTWASDAAKSVNRSFGNLRADASFSKLLGGVAMGELRAAGAMAMKDFVGGVRSGLGALAFVGGEIGTAMKKTAIQAGDFLKRNLGPLVPYMKSFGTGLINGFKSGLGSLSSVGEGFRGVFNTIKSMADTAAFNLRNIGLTAGVAAGIVKFKITDAFNSAKESALRFGTLAGAYLKDIGPSLATGMRGVSNTFKGMADTAKDNLRNVALYAGVAGGVAKMHIANAFNAMKTSALQFGALGKAYLADFANTGKGHFTALKNSALQNLALMKAYMGPTMESMRSATQPLRNSLGHMWDSFYAGSIYAEKRIRDSFSAIGKAGRIVGDGFKAMGTQIGQAGSYVSAAMQPALRTLGALPRTISTAIGTASTTMRQTLGGMASEVSGKVQTITGAVGRVANTAASGVSRSITGIRDTAVSAARNIAGNFAPVGAAFGALGASAAAGAATVKSHIGTITTAFGKIAGSTVPAIKAIGGVTGALGKAGVSGLGLAAAGIMNLLGGGWGIALMGATAVIGELGKKTETTKAQIENLASTLDKTSGAVTAQTEKNLAELLQKKPDKAMGLFDYGKSAFDNAKSIGVATDMFNKAVAGDPESREKFLKFQQDFQAAINKNADTYSEAPLQEFLKAQNIEGLNTQDAIQYYNQLNGQYEQYKVELEQAQKKIQDVADVTHTNSAQAAILSANYDTLQSKTSSVSDKFNALKANLDVLNGKQLSATEANKSYHQSLDDTAAALQAVKDKNEGNLKGLVDAKGAFDMSKSAARDLHTVLSGQADSILQLGVATLDNALKNGESMENAKAKGMAAMEQPIKDFEASLAKMGFMPDQIKAIVSSFGLVKDKYETAISVKGADQATMDMARVALAGQAFAQGNYEAALKVLPDSAKAGIAETFGLADEFARGDYEAILKTLNGAKGGIASVMGDILTWKNGDYAAMLKARNTTGPGVHEAKLSIDAVTLADYVALIKAKAGGGGPEVEAALNWIARNRTVSIGVVYNNQGVAKPPGSIARPGDPIGNNGGVILPGKSPFSGPFPMGMFKSFANGGFENHVAQISRGQSPFRIWSEPETGGEAYIPLSLAKRKRSKEILELVARQFGFGLVQMFGDGGFSNAITGGGNGAAAAITSSTSTRMQAPSGPLVAVYPSAALDEEKVGTYAARQLWFDIQNK